MWNSALPASSPTTVMAVCAASAHPQARAASRATCRASATAPRSSPGRKTQTSGPFAGLQVG
ncbi:hypothetical protein C3Y87_08695 [Carbonactinospora thermoautotrophica]|nr:hypothetical protein [Carbonactinospora thermoautotrophica]